MLQFLKKNPRIPYYFIRLINNDDVFSGLCINSDDNSIIIYYLIEEIIDLFMRKNEIIVSNNKVFLNTKTYPTSIGNNEQILTFLKTNISNTNYQNQNQTNKLILSNKNNEDQNKNFNSTFQPNTANQPNTTNQPNITNQPNTTNPPTNISPIITKPLLVPTNTNKYYKINPSESNTRINAAISPKRKSLPKTNIEKEIINKPINPTTTTIDNITQELFKKEIDSNLNIPQKNIKSPIIQKNIEKYTQPQVTLKKFSEIKFIPVTTKVKYIYPDEVSIGIPCDIKVLIYSKEKRKSNPNENENPQNEKKIKTNFN